MKKFLKVAGIVFCLISFLSVGNLSAQQYRVDVSVGTLDCGSGAQAVDLDITGTIAIGLTQGSAQSRVINAPVGQDYIIFSGTFGTQPDNMFLSDLATVVPAEGSCATSFFDETVPLIDNQNNQLQQTYPIAGDLGGSLLLKVTFTEVGLDAGSIGYAQTICDSQVPAELISVDAANGAISWQYSESGSAPWINIHTDPNDLTSDLYTESDYKPLALSQDRWFRRAATLEGETLYTNPVKITVIEPSLGSYLIEFYLDQYRCNTQVHDVVLDMDLTVGGELFNIDEVTPGTFEPVFTHEFVELPASLYIDNTNLVSTTVTDEPECEGNFVDNRVLSSTLGSKIPYQTVNGSEILEYSVKITRIGPPALPPGHITEDQILCVAGQTESIIEDTPPGGTAPYAYNWEYSTDGIGWMSSGVTTKDFPPQTLSADTWYRRVITSGCSMGISNTVKVTIADPLVIDITGHSAEYEVDDAEVTLIGSPTGGTFNGGEMIGNVFNPAQAGPGLHTITYTYTSPQGCTGNATVDISVKIVAEALCSSIVPLAGSGEFVLDSFSGRIVYQKNDDCAKDIPLMCIATQPNAPVITNVVSASAITLSDDWDYSPYYEPRYETTMEQANSFETGILGKWRTKASYVFSTDNVARDKNYNTGTFDIDAFNWQYAEVNQSDKWIPASRVDKYSPNGEALEERNAIDIASTVKMGYYDHLPYLTAQNATYESVFFESFELTYGSGQLESGSSIHPSADRDNAVAHAGSWSLALGPAEGIITPFIQAPNQSGDMLVQLWVKGALNEQLVVQIQPEDATSTIVQVTEIARSGDWGLYQAVLDIDEGTSFKLAFRYMGAENIWIDDVRVQPVDAEMTCYVYDPATLRLLTIFDGQHFGLYYQYDGEGKLVRKTIETERGTRTLQETFYNVPKTNK